MRPINYGVLVMATTGLTLVSASSSAAIQSVPLLPGNTAISFGSASADGQWFTGGMDSSTPFRYHVGDSISEALPSQIGDSSFVSYFPRRVTNAGDMPVSISAGAPPTSTMNLYSISGSVTPIAQGATLRALSGDGSRLYGTSGSGLYSLEIGQSWQNLGGLSNTVSFFEAGEASSNGSQYITGQENDNGKWSAVLYDQTAGLSELHEFDQLAMEAFYNFSISASGNAYAVSSMLNEGPQSFVSINGMEQVIDDVMIGSIAGNKWTATLGFGDQRFVWDGTVYLTLEAFLESFGHDVSEWDLSTGQFSQDGSIIWGRGTSPGGVSTLYYAAVPEARHFASILALAFLIFACLRRLTKQK